MKAPYKEKIAGKEQRAFNDAVWEIAQRVFVLQVWSRGAFFLLDRDSTKDNVGEENGLDDEMVDAYEVGVAQYKMTQSQEMAEKYRLQIREEGVLSKLRQKVSAILSRFIFS